MIEPDLKAYEKLADEEEDRTTQAAIRNLVREVRRLQEKMRQLQERFEGGRMKQAIARIEGLQDMEGTYQVDCIRIAGTELVLDAPIALTASTRLVVEVTNKCAVLSLEWKEVDG